MGHTLTVTIDKHCDAACECGKWELTIINTSRAISDARLTAMAQREHEKHVKAVCSRPAKVA